jgi:hypothetical protein
MHVWLIEFKLDNGQWVPICGHRDMAFATKEGAELVVSRYSNPSRYRTGLYERRDETEPQDETTITSVETEGPK